MTPLAPCATAILCHRCNILRSQCSKVALRGAAACASPSCRSESDHLDLVGVIATWLTSCKCPSLSERCLCFRPFGLDWKGSLGMARKFDRVEQVLQTSVLSGNDPWLHSRAILPFWDRGLAA